MDHNFIIFIMFTTLFLTSLTYLEWLYKSKKTEEINKSKSDKLNGHVVRERNKRNRPTEREAMINYITKFKLEYDPDTHTYIKVEKLRPEEVEIIKPK